MEFGSVKLPIDEPIVCPALYIWYLTDTRGHLIGRGLSLYMDPEHADQDFDGAKTHGLPEFWCHSIRQFTLDDCPKCPHRLGSSVRQRI